MSAIVRAHEQFGVGELALDQIDDLIGDLGLFDADGDQARAAGTGGAQHIEAGAVAVIDLEAEAAGALDHLDVAIDDGHVHALGQEKLRDHLAEAAEADDQHRAAGVGEVVRGGLGLAIEPLDQPLAERRKRRAE